MIDYYKVLGVTRNATAAEIKQAYRKLIKGCHPDVNSSPKAAEWARQLNEAYSILSDPRAKASYDMDLTLEESGQRDASARQTRTSRARAETKPPPVPEPNLRCEECGRADPSLRVSAILGVRSGIYWSRKEPIVRILCNKCRVKTSLVASAFTFCRGWWAFDGFFWTLEALIKNAFGGEQEKEKNATLLRALSFQFYKSGRTTDAYKALAAALELKPDPEAVKILDKLKEGIEPAGQKSAWDKFRGLELHPFYYHVPAGTIAIALIIIGIIAVNAGSSPSGSAPPPGANYALEPQKSTTPTRLAPENHKPAFSEPELPLPEQGGLLLSESLTNYSGTTAPFKLTTSSDGNYVMKIEDWNTKEFVALYFIPRSSTLTIELPLGSYRLKFAQGDRWYGTEYLFGPETTYSYVPDRMDFYVSGDYVRGHEVELTPQFNGNLQTPTLRAQDW